MTHINGDNDSLLSLLVESPTAEEDLFDLTKVFELGKDVKNYSEEFLDSGIRLFNDVANKVKNTVELENQRNFEEEDIDGNEWMHNYL
ncbi:hypothetical protein G6F56_008871 [Rhizopus delemar]|nr:hypothetical protein G6F56_008871 [Rhizopus delemar]